jgi:hypothetical protein
LIQLKDELPKFKKNQIKYDFERFEIRNNFSYWNFSKCWWRGGGDIGGVDW